MITLNVSKTSQMDLLPTILQSLGVKHGGEVDLVELNQGVMLLPKKVALFNTQKQDLIEQQINEAFGMVKVNIPKGFNLLDIDIADYVPLFDEDE